MNDKVVAMLALLIALVALGIVLFGGKTPSSALTDGVPTAEDIPQPAAPLEE
jgi:hypothetical protein